MSDTFWKKANFIIGILPMGALFGLMFFVAHVEIKDLDLWLHIGMGRYLMQNNIFPPSVDILSNSIQGSPWINHEWLFQIIVYNIFNIWGADGLSWMQISVVCSTMLVLWFLGYNKEKQISVTFVLILVYLVFQQRFTIRPDIFSLLFFALYIFILALHIDKKWSIYALFVIQVLWSNMHGFFFFGPLFVCIGLVSEWIKRTVPLPYEWNDSGRLTDIEYKRLRSIFFVVILACLINPQFVEGALYPIVVFFSLSGENKIFFKYIQELQKPITPDTIFLGGKYVFYKFLIFLSVISFVLNRRRIDISALFFWLIFLMFSLQAVRNTAFFAFAAYLVIVTNLLPISYKDIFPLKFSEERFKYITLIIVKILLIMWIFKYCGGISMRSYYDFDKYEQRSEFGGISKNRYPDKGVDFLVKNKVKGNFFNDFNSGAYLIGRCFPDIKVFIDGRTEVYGGQFFMNYNKMWNHGDTELFEEASKKYNFTGAFLNSVNQFIPKEILKYLYENEKWKLVYFDYDSVIFLKEVPANKELIKKYKIDLSKWKTKELDLFKIGSTKVKPYRNYYRAYSLETLGFDKAALKEAEAALKVSPSYPEPYGLIGKIYSKEKDYQNVFENFRIATMLSPANKDFRYNLALSYIDLEHYEGAIKQYKVIKGLWPNDPKVYFYLSKAYALNDQYDESITTLKQASAMDPRVVKDIIKIGDIVFDKGEYSKAKEIYEIPIKADKDQGLIHEKLGLIYKALNDLKRSNEEFDKAIKINPDDKELRDRIKEIKQQN